MVTVGVPRTCVKTGSCVDPLRHPHDSQRLIGNFFDEVAVRFDEY